MASLKTILMTNVENYQFFVGARVVITKQEGTIHSNRTLSSSLSLSCSYECIILLPDPLFQRHVALRYETFSWFCYFISCPESHRVINITYKDLSMLLTVLLGLFLRIKFEERRTFPLPCQQSLRGQLSLLPFTLKMALVFLLSICHTILMMSVRRIWFCIC